MPHEIIVIVGLCVLALLVLMGLLAGMFRKLSLPALNPPHFSP